MHSIRTKLLIYICFLVIGVYAVLIGTSTYYIDNIIDTDSRITMNSLAEKKSYEINSKFKSVERAVDVIGGYIKKTIDTDRLNNDKNYINEYNDELNVKLSEVARILGNVASVYFRLNPYDYGGTSGIFLADDGYGEYINVAPTDILAYDENDREHVGWYYEPVESGHAIWMEPYNNKNINVNMVSYVEPIYIQGRLFGIVGMDINMSVVHSIVDNVEYEEGTGFLVDGRGNIVYHRDYPAGLKVVKFNDELRQMGQYFAKEYADSDKLIDITWNGIRHCMVLDNISNGMLLAIMVPYSELSRPIEGLRNNLITISGIVVLVLVLIIWRVQVKIINPIRSLTRASSRIAKGEMNVPIDYHAKDEIGELAGSVRSMRKELQEYFAYIHRQAYMDAMTGVGNKTAYFELLHNIDRKIHEGMADFGVIIFDINGLKNVNDKYGHECGDILITDASEVLKRIFGAEHIYRIGGDEFIIVLEHVNKDIIEEYFVWYEAALNEVNETERPYKTKLSISKGYAMYDYENDREYKEVFRRADSSMYKAKEEYYQGRNDRRKR